MGKLTMNTKKVAITTVVTGLVLSLGVWSANSLNVATSKSETSKSIPIQKVYGNHMLFDSIEEVEQHADLIVVGKITKDLEENQPVVTRNSGGGIEDFYTVTDFEVKKVLKGSTANNNIQVLQPAVIMNEVGTQTLLIREDYSLLKKGSSYLLFLVQVEGGGYSIISINQGKFSLDKTDQKEQEIEKEDLQYANLKAKALSKFKDRLVTP